MQKQYERHRREYTLVGISAVIDAMVGKVLSNVYDGSFEEMISVVQNDVYWHFQVDGDRERVSKLFLEKVNRGEINFSSEYELFDKQVSEFEEKVLFLPKENYSLQTYQDFFHYYQLLIPIAYTGMDSADFVSILRPELQQPYLDWATQIRLRGEVIYKNGEMKFIPEYTEWLASAKLTRYSAEELRYLTCHELLGYCQSGIALPEPVTLRARIQNLFYRQGPGDEQELLNGDAAVKKISELHLLDSPEDTITELSVLKGVTAFPGIVQGRVRIIRTRNDMNSFLDNEIIVSGMTDPSYLPIMKRASAFVTNEGGVLCHAAIVARELKKPCIIATKFATHTLKDGDLVEVNADLATVTKL